MTKQFFNNSITVFTRLTKSMEKNLLWKLFHRIRNQRVSLPYKHIDKENVVP